MCCMRAGWRNSTRSSPRTWRAASRRSSCSPTASTSSRWRRLRCVAAGSTRSRAGSRSFRSFVTRPRCRRTSPPCANCCEKCGSSASWRPASRTTSPPGICTASRARSSSRAGWTGSSSSRCAKANRRCTSMSRSGPTAPSLRSTSTRCLRTAYAAGSASRAPFSIASSIGRPQHWTRSMRASTGSCSAARDPASSRTTIHSCSGGWVARSTSGSKREAPSRHCCTSRNCSTSRASSTWWM